MYSALLLHQSFSLNGWGGSAPAKPLTPGARQERREPMSRLRQRIAERLLASQQNNAILTTFNEVNMQSVMDLRARWKDRFAEKHGVKLGRYPGAGALPCSECQR